MRRLVRFATLTALLRAEKHLQALKDAAPEMFDGRLAAESVAACIAEEEGQGYTVQEAYCGGQVRLVDCFGRTVDICHGLSSAAYSAELLNSGAGRLNPHAVIGCRVELI